MFAGRGTGGREAAAYLENNFRSHRRHGGVKL